MKTTILLITSISLFAWSNIETRTSGSLEVARTLKALYGPINNAPANGKIEYDGLKLADYNLIVKSDSNWAGYSQSEGMWESLAKDRTNELNVIVVYDDAPSQDALKLKSKSPNTKMYEFLDHKREFYYWFPNKQVLDAVLIGPNGKILFEGQLNSQQKINEIKAIVKKRFVY